MCADDLDFWDVSDDVYNAVREAEVAAEGAALRASAQAALLHWAALALLCASLLLGFAMFLLPPLRPWSGQAIWVVILGILAYLAVVAIVYWTHPKPSSSELRAVWKLRHGIAALLVEQQTSRTARRAPVLIDALSDAIRHLDEQILPALQRLVERRAKLNRELGRYERGELHTPAPHVLERVLRRHTRLQITIDEYLQHAANAYAALVLLLQEDDDGRRSDRVREWADDLLTLYDSLDEVLRGTEDSSEADAEANDEEAPVDADATAASEAADPGDTAEPDARLGDETAPDDADATAVPEAADPGDTVEADARLGDESAPVDAEAEASTESEPPAVTLEAIVAESELDADESAPAGADPIEEPFGDLVEKGLRRMLDLGKLSTCEVMDRLPLTMAMALRERRNGQRGASTSLEKAQALYDVLLAGINRLRLADDPAGAGTSRNYGYRVLHLQYVVGLQPPQIADRLGIATRTVFRHRDTAVDVLVRDLGEQEERLRRDEQDGATC